MKRQSLAERLEEVVLASGKSYSEIANAAGISHVTLISMRNGGNNHFSKIEVIARYFDLIPLIIYRQDNGNIEDLGVPGFLQGATIDNYVGRVVRKHRLERELDQEELSKKTSGKSYTGSGESYICQSEIGACECGDHVPTVRFLERIVDALELTPRYLVKKERVVKFDVRSFKENIRYLEYALIAEHDSFNRDQARKALEYARRIGELGNFLAAKLDVLKK